MDLPKILLTGLVFLFFLVFLEFLDSWAWDSKNLEKNQINQKNQSWMDLPKILLTGLVFWVFGQLGLGQQKPREKPNKPKKQKKQSWMDLPKILLTGLVFLVFLVFLEFLDSWAWDSKNLEKNQINQKNQSWMDLPKILLTGLFFFVFFVFFGFPRVFGQLGLGQQKPREKPNKPKKNKKKQSWMDLPKILLTPEPPKGTKKSARFIFVRFCFFRSNAFPPKKSARYFFLLMNSASNPTLSVGSITYGSGLNIFVLF